MKKWLGITLCVFILTVGVSAATQAYDLVLCHGLTNKHRWSEDFLNECIKKFGSGNVYVIYRNSEVYDSRYLGTVTLSSGSYHYSGNNSYTAGDDYIQKQYEYMRAGIERLQAYKGLDNKFKILAHSMGGLVARYYIWQHPYTVAGMVTLNTPHQGAVLAYDDYNSWTDLFIGASDAIYHLRPDVIQGWFNSNYPVTGAPLADGGRVYTTGGDCDWWNYAWDCYGAMGELKITFPIIYVWHGQDNDGLVAHGEEDIAGATKIAKWWSYDHNDVVRMQYTAQVALGYLTP